MRSSCFDKIANLHLEDALCQRTISLDIDKTEVGTQIVAWQCNMAGMKNTDVKLPTVLHITLDDDGVVDNAELMGNFKGSQGIPCSRSYLNRILKNRLIGISFVSDDTILRNEFMFDCSHIFELIAGAQTLFKHSNCTSKVYDFTKAYKTNDGIILKGRFMLNDHLITCDVHFIFSSENISMNSLGKISKIRNLKMEATLFSGEKKIAEISDSISNISESTNIIMNLMKLFTKLWKAVGKEIGINRNFYFTNLVPCFICLHADAYKKTES